MNCRPESAEISRWTDDAASQARGPFEMPSIMGRPRTGDGLPQLLQRLPVPAGSRPQR